MGELLNIDGNQPLIIDDNIPLTNENKELIKKSKSIIIKCNYEYINTLPDEIENIRILNHSNFNQPLTNLPFHLKNLQIYELIFNQPLDNLPNNLENLTIGCKNYNLPLDYLSHNLKSLVFVRFTKYKQHLLNLPKNIKSIDIYTFYPYKNELILNYPNTVVKVLEW